jgi:predicted molibdopterin-dependent oxidoreductase YjgC
MITVTINNKEIKLEKPVTILEAARSAGIKIPPSATMSSSKIRRLQALPVEVERRAPDSLHPYGH